MAPIFTLNLSSIIIDQYHDVKYEFWPACGR